MEIPVSEVYFGDCMEYMKDIPDKFFELAIVDPPYNIGGTALHSNRSLNGAGKLKDRAINKFNTKWDNEAPPVEYFEELFRISKNQIIWGGNYYDLPICRGFIIWDKMQPWENFSACEFAWTSFDMPSKIFREATTRTGETKIHPTQKSVELYKFCLKFAQKNDNILDTHLGSQSSRIAAYDLGFDFYGCELDEDYFKSGCERFEQHRKKKEEVKEFGYAKTELSKINPLLFEQ